MVAVRQFDVVRNPHERSAHVRPFVMILQSDHLDDQTARIVAPLVLDTVLAPASRLTPVFEIEGRSLVLSITELAALPLRILKAPVANFSGRRDDIVRALDLLFVGL